ncbi:MAG: carboxy-S-adenosyl-L-methionine synthase CmoA [Acidobacteria bacterium]|nr:MAG: carboxy-S-adenosyl-L-methionine synthase CmoA [Acidobacteriota bacterium]PIE89968.1 MAG: carboxy-S-adenosyl-L-methionine synthase CmoA [Acidobacteriota bacterium]
MTKDQLFQNTQPLWGSFQFDDSVTGVFDDMLNRSIPQYRELQDMILELIRIYYQPSSCIVDLGCSLGTLLAKIHCAMGDRIARQIGVDSSPHMIEKARTLLKENIPEAPVELLCRDILDYNLENTSVVIMNYTLQFIRPIQREKLMAKIWTQLKPGGILILSEKVLESVPKISSQFHDIYYNFKKKNGYTDTELANKRASLEHVLIPYSVKEYEELLEKAGFQSSHLFHKWFNFASILAIKGTA